MRKLLFCYILLSCSCTILYSQPNEYVIKGVFLEKFTRFVDWPEASNVTDTLKPFIIGIVGKDPFQSKLDELYNNRKIKKKKVRVVHCNSIDQIDQCDLLFISASETYRFSRIINRITGKPILTISDGDVYSGRGAIINLKIIDNKIRFEIDESAIQKSGLHFSHLLLKEAEIINPLR